MPKQWNTASIGKKPLAGFSHGVAGIAWALLELEAMTGEERFRKVALEAIAYERSLFCLKVGNWPDLREFENAVLSESKGLVNFMTAWCHGAPGIGNGRLRSLPHLDKADIRAEIDTALKTTLTQGFGFNHCLCHGDLGNLDLLLQASLTLDDPKWHFQVNRLAAIILESINQHGWLCGVPLGVETPGLMLFHLQRLQRISRKVFTLFMVSTTLSAFGSLVKIFQSPATLDEKLPKHPLTSSILNH